MRKGFLIVVLGIVFFLSFVSAHTGNDAYDHYMTTADLIFGAVFIVFIIALLLLIIWLIKKYKKKK